VLYPPYIDRTPCNVVVDVVADVVVYVVDVVVEDVVATSVGTRHLLPVTSILQSHNVYVCY